MVSPCCLIVKIPTDSPSKKAQIKNRVNEIIQVMNARQDLLEQFDDELFNALVEKITILSPTRYLFTLKSGLEIEELEE
jgi:site-specific DNA recombinase